MDDKHFSRLLAELILSYREAGDTGVETSEAGGAEYRDFVLERDEDDLLVLNKSRGGAFKIYREGALVEEDRGITVSRSGKRYTSNWAGTTESTYREDGELMIEGRMQEVPRSRLRGLEFLLFHLFQYSLGRSRRLSLAVKNRLIDRLITGKSEGPKFSRTFDLEDWTVHDEFQGEEIEGRSVKEFVPSTEYFLLPELSQGPGGNR